jgi:chemotaxis protein MotB
MKKARRKFTKEKHADHDDGWIVSYADMMTLLFGFFVILYSFSQVDEKKLSEFGQEIAQTMGSRKKASSKMINEETLTEARQKRALELLIGTLNLGTTIEEGIDRIETEIGQAKDSESAQQAIKDAVAQSGSKRGELLIPDIKEKDRALELVMPADVLFHSGGQTLDPTGMVRLQQLAREISSYADLIDVEVIGHTDSSTFRANDSQLSNWSLSAGRAATVANIFMTSGVPSTRITAKGLADTQPLFAERDEQGRFIPANQARNRRIEIVIRRGDHATSH